MIRINSIFEKVVTKIGSTKQTELPNKYVIKVFFQLFNYMHFQEQECFLEELRKAQRKLLKVARDRR